MPANDGTQRKPSSSSVQQHAQVSLQQQLDSSVDNSSTVTTTASTTTPSGLNAEFFHCLTQNLLSTTVAGTSGQSQGTDATTGASVAAAFGLPIPDVSMMYGNVNLYNLFNLNLLTESQQNQQQQSSSLLTEYLRQRTVEVTARQHQQRQQQQQRQQRPSKEKKRVRIISNNKCKNFFF